MDVEDIYNSTNNLLEIIFMKYSDKFLIFFTVIFYTWRYFLGDIVTFIPALPVLLFGMFVPSLLFRKYAYKVIIDQGKREFTFLMARKKEPITLKVEELKNIIVNFNVTFQFNNNIIKFNKASDSHFLIYLESVKPVTYKFLGRIVKKYL